MCLDNRIFFILNNLQNNVCLSCARDVKIESDKVTYNYHCHSDENKCDGDSPVDCVGTNCCCNSAHECNRMSKDSFDKTREEAAKLGEDHQAMPKCYEHETDYVLKEEDNIPMSVTEKIWHTGTVLFKDCHACGTVCFSFSF